MSSFFTLPASQKKRKRSQPATQSTTGSGRKAVREDESISGSDVSDGDDLNRLEAADASQDEDDDIEDEDPAAKRVRLAERYLANAQKEVLEDGAFDAADVDQENLRRRTGERLKEDTAEGKGRLHRWIADGLDWRGATRQICKQLNMKKTVTGAVIQGKYAYAVSEDLQLVKLELPGDEPAPKGRRSSRQAKVIARTRGNKDPKAQHHHKAILCVAVSPDGKFVATGGADKKLIIWNAATLQPLKVFAHHRDQVTALTFRRGTNQLYSASRDRTIKTWSLNELAYVETLYGHQDGLTGIDALAQEKCTSVGARDRTARLWKVVEESQLVFRGGGSHGTFKASESLKHAYKEDPTNGHDANIKYNEGSIDCIAMVDDETFVTGSDNGSLSLWNIHKKKATFTVPLAHGLDPPLPLEQASAEQDANEQLDEEQRGRGPRWITALKAVPFSDVLISGSWDGYVRVWKISKEKRQIEALGAIGAQADSLDALLAEEGLNASSLTNGALEAMRSGLESQGPINGIVNGLDVIDRGERGKDGLLVVAAVGKEHRLGSWKKVVDGKNCVALFKVPPILLDDQPADNDQDATMADGDENGFEGFD